MFSPKPFSVLIVPGSWHVPAHFKPLISELESRHIEASTLLLPTCDLSNASVLDLQHPDLAGPPPSEPWPDMYADALAIRKSISQLVESGRSVLLVAHSYGGLPASEALLSELSYQARKQQDKPGGVIGFFAIASFFLPVGMTTKQAVGGDQLPSTPVQVCRQYCYFLPAMLRPTEITCSPQAFTSSSTLKPIFSTILALSNKITGSRSYDRSLGSSMRRLCGMPDI